MKALFSSAIAMLLVIQLGCASQQASPVALQNAIQSSQGSATLTLPAMKGALPAPEVAVMPMKEGILVAWKPIENADGYFVYRETQDDKKLLGIGPKDAQGFIDRTPSDTEAKYSVQAFKVSELSEKQKSDAQTGPTQQSESKMPLERQIKGMPVSWEM